MLIETIVSLIIAPLVEGGEHLASQKIRQLLKRDPEHLAVQHALNEAQEEIKRNFPEYAQAFFDEQFLRTRAAPILTRYLKVLRVSTKLKDDLARAYAAQLSTGPQQSYIEQCSSVATAFLRAFDSALRRQPEFVALFDSLALRDIDHSTARAADSVESIKTLFEAHIQTVTPPSPSTRLPTMDEEPVAYGPPLDVEALPLSDTFVDRASEQAWIVDRLRAAARNRIVAVRGMPGVGKTSLIAACMQTMHEAGRFADGIAIISCDGITDPSALLRQILARFDHHRRPPVVSDSELSDLAKVRLQGKDALIVLDNIGPALEMRGVVASLRQAGVALVLSSNQLLGREIVPQHATRQIQLLPEDDALELFAEAYGKTAFDDFSAHDQDAARQIVQQLARHTLAVKLAGAYAGDYHRPLLAVARQLEDLQHALDLPDGEAEHAVASIFRKSESSLSSGAQQVFTSLATFATPEFGRDAGVALAQALGVESPEVAIDQLIRRALLESAEPLADDPLRPAATSERLYFHPLLRALATQNIGRWDASRRVAAARGLATHYASTIRESDFDAIAGDERNITESFKQSLARGDDHVAVQLAMRMRFYWRERNVVTEAEQLLAEAVLAAARIQEKHPDKDGSDHAHAVAELRLSHAHALCDLGDFPTAQSEVEAARTESRSLADPILESKALYELALIAWYQGQVQFAQRYAEESIEAARASTQPYRATYGLLLLAHVNAAIGQLEKAAEFAGKASELAHDADNIQLATAARFMQTLVKVPVSDTTGPEPIEDMLRSFVDLAQGAASTQELDVPAAMYQLVTEAHVRHDQIGEGSASLLAGMSALTQGQMSESQTYFESAQQIANNVSMPLLSAGSLFLRAAMAEFAGQFDLAEERYISCLAQLDETEAPLLQAYAHGYYGVFLIHHRDSRDGGCAALHTAISICERNNLTDLAVQFRAAAKSIGCSETDHESE